MIAWHSLGRLVANRNLLKNLIIRDLKYRYVGSVGGFLWSFVHPLVLLVSYTFVFTVVFRQRMGPHNGTDNFPLFLFCGILPWTFFQDSVTRSCSSITENAQLITKTTIPAEILPIAITMSSLVHHGIGLAILLTILVFTGSLHLSAIGVIVYLPVAVLFAQGLGWLVATLHVFIRDTLQAVQIVMFLWFWFTPVFYTDALVPEAYRPWIMANPMAVVIKGYRESLLNTGSPDPVPLLGMLAASMATFLVGAWFFRRTKHGFADVL